jgi:ubiquinone/menaquinone biosynthesis C-methylase UbiE
VVKSKIRSWAIKGFLIPDKVLSNILTRISRNLKTDNISFGWRQAIFPCLNIDQWQRYACVVQEIKNLGALPVSILDVGAGKDFIREFINTTDINVHILDINVNALITIKDRNIRAVAGSGCHLPFKDESFDIVTSLDSLEHIPDAKKAAYCRELKRVTKRYTIVHCPADSADGVYQSTTYDRMFLQWHRRFLKTENPSTLEHLSSGLPKLELLQMEFPGAKIQARQNCNLWLIYMKMLSIPYIKITAGICYKTFLMRKDNRPPFKSCLLVWRKSG